MMPLPLLVSLYEFRQFLQIVLWIAVPATLVAVGLTIFFHYRRRKKHQELELAFQDENSWPEKLDTNLNTTTIMKTTTGQSPENLPDWLASSNPDNIPLLKKYEHEVRRYRENYAILEQDFKELEGKYTDLRNKAYHTDKETDTTLVAQLQEEIKEYKEKNGRLHTQLAEQECLPDMLEEKRAEIEFLQKQLEQRIKNYHQLEQQAGESATQLQQLQHALTDKEDSMRVLRENLATEQQKNAILETRLEASGQQLMKIYAELTKTLTHNGLMTTIDTATKELETAEQKEAVLQF